MTKITVGSTQMVIIALTLATAAIHLILGVQFNDTLFLLNGLGFLGLLAVLYIPIELLSGFRGLARWILLGYTSITIMLFFIFNGADALTSVPGLITKGIEVVLVILLLRSSLK